VLRALDVLNARVFWKRLRRRRMDDIVGFWGVDWWEMS
jgi:hypothetical protein